MNLHELGFRPRKFPRGQRQDPCSSAERKRQKGFLTNKPVRADAWLKCALQPGNSTITNNGHSPAPPCVRRRAQRNSVSYKPNGVIVVLCNARSQSCPYVGHRLLVANESHNSMTDQTRTNNTQARTTLNSTQPATTGPCLFLLLLLCSFLLLPKRIRRIVHGRLEFVFWKYSSLSPQDADLRWWIASFTP